jgi:hypothetical protein
MYGLANIDFSRPLGVVVSEPLPEEIDRQAQTLKANPGAALSDLETASSLARHLEMAVFGAP